MSFFMMIGLLHEIISSNIRNQPANRTLCLLCINLILNIDINLLIRNFACACNMIALICEGFFRAALAFLMNGEVEKMYGT